MRPPSLTAVQCADSPHSPAHAPCSPPATSHYTTGRLQAWDLCAPCRRLLHCGADFPAPTPPVREERSALRMAKKRSEPRRPSTPTAFEQARDELFECGGGGRASGFRTFLGHAQGAPLFSNWRCGRGEIGAAM